MTSPIKFIQATFDHLSSEPLLRRDQVAVCITIPLTIERFDKEINGIKWWGKLFGISKDFVNTYSKSFGKYWEGEGSNGYENRVAMPVLQYLLAIREMGVLIKHDCTFLDLEELVNNENIKFIILLAHHYGDRIEFADGGKPLNKITTFFNSNYITRSVSYCFLVCEAEPFALELRSVQGIQSISSSPYKVSVVHAVHFIKFWIGAIDGSRTLSEAYQLALQKYYLDYK